MQPRDLEPSPALSSNPSRRPGFRRGPAHPCFSNSSTRSPFAGPGLRSPKPDTASLPCCILDAQHVFSCASGVKQPDYDTYNFTFAVIESAPPETSASTLQHPPAQQRYNQYAGALQAGLLDRGSAVGMLPHSDSGMHELPVLDVRSLEQVRCFTAFMHSSLSQITRTWLELPPGSHLAS